MVIYVWGRRTLVLIIITWFKNCKLINGKTARYDRIINELCHFYKFSLIKTGLMFHRYHVLNQLQVFRRYNKWLYGCAKYFWIVFTIKLKRNNLRHELKKYMLKQALISLLTFMEMYTILKSVKTIQKYFAHPYNL
jgi:hypothetical protein